MTNEEILNIAMMQSAIDSGFKPAWVSVTAKSNKFIEKML